MAKWMDKFRLKAVVNSLIDLEKRNALRQEQLAAEQAPLGIDWMVRVTNDS